MSGESTTLTSLPELWEGKAPEILDIYGAIPRKFSQYELILKPDTIAPQWWAGAPSVVRDKEGIFWMACRMRSAEFPRGLRGYEIRILRSEDGVHFEKVHGILREEVPIPGFERPALCIDPNTGKFKLYGCGPWQGGPWTIIKFDDVDSPEQFVGATARPVIQAYPKTYEHDVPPAAFKDQVIIYSAGKWHCYVIGLLRDTERIFHFVSEDGEAWQPVGSIYEPVMQLQGWHNFYVRPASLLPVGVGWLFVYEGSNASWFDPVYNIATGLAFTFDLNRIIDLTPESLLLKSTTPNDCFHTWRYSHWMWVNDEIWVYAEVTAPDETNEIRLYRFNREP